MTELPYVPFSDIEGDPGEVISGARVEGPNTIWIVGLKKGDARPIDEDTGNPETVELCVIQVVEIGQLLLVKGDGVVPMIR